MEDLKELLRHVDHTLLKQEASWEQIAELCEEGMKYRTASVCIPPCHVRQAKAYVAERSQELRIPEEEQTRICTVIGFPNGYCTTAVKEAECRDAIENGADEIDMVINLSDLKAKKYIELENELRTIRQACDGRILKVIIETCLLSQEEKIKMCELVTRAGADYIKTSTGFSTGGATFEDVRLLASHVGPKVKVKAAGGITTLEDAKEFLRLGADRLGTSRIVALVKAEEARRNVGHRDGRISDQALFSFAKLARQNSYAPYSGFHVGAALLTEEGKVYTGCNVENAAYTPTNCAERTAFFKAVGDGERSFVRIAIAGGSGENIDDFTAPCGVCRQVMMEFCDPKTFEIVLGNKKDELRVYRLEELLPLGFELTEK